MPDIVIVPTFSRPEMLQVCLEHIFACPEAADAEVRVVVDQHAGRLTPLLEIREVARHFPVVTIVREPHRYSGNSFNVLSSYTEAYQSQAELVYLVEDDVMVSPDFFTWHRQVQLDADPFCSIAIANPRRPVQRLEGFHLECDYASLGVCFRRGRLRAVIDHAVANYYVNQIGYLRRHFAAGDFFAEQDGLIKRVMEKHEFTAAWACVPRARHVGWYGYHRPAHRPHGPLHSRIATVRRRAATMGSIA